MWQENKYLKYYFNAADTVYFSYKSSWYKITRIDFHGLKEHDLLFWLTANIFFTRQTSDFWAFEIRRLHFIFTLLRRQNHLLAGPWIFVFYVLNELCWRPLKLRLHWAWAERIILRKKKTTKHFYYLSFLLIELKGNTQYRSHALNSAPLLSITPPNRLTFWVRSQGEQIFD